MDNTCEHDRCPWCGACHDTNCPEKVSFCEELVTEIAVYKDRPMRYYRDKFQPAWIYCRDERDTSSTYAYRPEVFATSDVIMVRVLFMWKGVTNFYQDVSLDYLENECVPIAKPD